MRKGNVAITSSISEELKKTFALASLRKEAAKILSAKEWKELQKNKERFDAQNETILLRNLIEIIGILAYIVLLMFYLKKENKRREKETCGEEG